MEPMTRRSHPLSRQEIKGIMRMPVPIFRKWIMTYSMTVYNLGIDDCREILHDEFGFGDKRIQRFMERLKEKHQKILNGGEAGDDGKNTAGRG